MRKRRILVGLVIGALAAAAAAVSALALRDASEGLEPALAYLPTDAELAVAVSTDFQGEQLSRLDAKLRVLGLYKRGIEEELRRDLRQQRPRIDYDREVKPLLGEQFVFGVPHGTGRSESEAFVAALEVRDPEQLLRLLVDRPDFVRPAGRTAGARVFSLRDAGGGVVALKNDELVGADSRRGLDAALKRRDDGTGLTEERFEERTGEVAEDAFLRGYTDASSPDFLSTLGLLGTDVKLDRQVKWVRSLRTLGFAGVASEPALGLDLSLTTDPEALTDEDLPLAAGSASPRTVRSDREIVSGTRDQAQILRFILRALRQSAPRGGFERRRRDLERDLGLDLERDVADQFRGDASIALGLDLDRFAARSEVVDPRALARTLRRVAPRLDELAASPSSPSESPIVLTAPALAALPEAPGARVRRVQGSKDLYRFEALGRRTVFGVVDGVFVAGSDEARARAIAREPTVPFEGDAGAMVLRFNARRALADLAGGSAARRSLGDLTATTEASTERVRTTVRLEVR